MRLTEWRRKAPVRESMDAQVMAVLEKVLADLGAEQDPECFVAWGEDPTLRYSILVPVVAGLVAIAVRTTAGAGDARANARLIRWPKLAIGEFAIEADAQHRLAAVQVESFVLKGVDAEADEICEFVRGLVIAADGRAAQPVTADLVKALTATLERIAVPVVAARGVARTGAAPVGVPRTRAVVALPGGAASRSRGRELTGKPASKSAAASNAAGPRSVARAKARPKAATPRVAPAVAPAHAPAEPPAEPAPEAAAESVAPSSELGLVVVINPVEAPGEAPSEAPAETPVETTSEAAAEPAVEPAVAPAPRKPRAPRKRAAPGEAAEAKPKRPRRVHRDWPEPSAVEPGWAGAPPKGDAAKKKKPQRWIP
jgi:hypothetical protein